ncbi:SLC13 family permease [Chroococcidiopsis sp. FACHB-1243]|uniref:SLC13 family permease n=1 Tax=Chroococcidiopsis sp. [FACHB-1243] TaxID=2692781 RepID=UPI00178061A3|nr:SLC13 family permease [Chroococcidiopsis sp. [FACHB-1243]]MBD2309479.1 SLC13 family permease [Chroococcidiopsis sp. [FACHB-1243]]
MDIALTFGVLGLAIVFFIFEWLPVDVTAIATAVVLMLLGLITPEEGIAGFSNSATITVLAMFILSGGIERTGAIQIVSDFLLRRGGKNPTRQIFVLGAIVGPITAFLNNTAVVAVFIPIVEEWSRKRNISVSKLLIPLSYATVLGGMITVIGTSTNVVASSLSKKLGYGEFSLFQFTPVGLITFAIGLVYLAFAAPKLLPDRKQPAATPAIANYGLKDYFSEVVVAPRSNLIGQTLRSSQIEQRFDIAVVELFHNSRRYIKPVADKVLAGGDIMIVRGNRGDVLKIRDERGIEILPEIEFQQEFPTSELNSENRAISEALIISNSSLIGSTLKELQFRLRYNLTVLAIRRNDEIIRDRLGKVRLQFGDVLLLQGARDSLIGLQNSADFLVVEPREVETLRRDKAAIAIAISLAVVITAAFEWIPILVSSLAGVVLMVATGVLKPREIYRSVRWDIIFLLAGLIPLGTAMDNSGATKWLASGLASLGGQFSGFWLLVCFYIATTVLTEILSNNAAVVLMLPVAANVAETLSLNPFAFMFVVTFAASNSYLTPIGYQTNTMVYGPGGYKFLDFTKVGAPLNLILTFLTPLLIAWLYGVNQLPVD